MQTLVPWVALAVALITVVGLLVSTRHIQKQEDKRQELKKDQENSLAALKQEHAEKLAMMQAGFSERLTELKADLDGELEQRNLLVRLNEENWRHVQEGIRALRDAGFAMTGAFRNLAHTSHTQITISEDQLVADSLNALKRHDEFRMALKKLRAEIRPKDYAALERLLKYLVIVFLDVGRTPAERTTKATQMHKHERIISRTEVKFEKLIQQFVQPYRPKSHRVRSYAAPPSGVPANA